LSAGCESTLFLHWGQKSKPTLCVRNLKITD
jgi:hypothetical protein